MAVPIRILLAENSTDETALVLQGLRRAGYDPTAVGPDRQLQHERDLLRLVLDANADLMFVKDSSGHFILANQAVADLYGTTADLLIGRSESDLNPQARETLRSAAAEQEVISSGRPLFVRGESVTDPRTGATRWFDVRRQPVVVPGCHAGSYGQFGPHTR